VNGKTFGISITTREGMKSCSEPSRINWPRQSRSDSYLFNYCDSSSGTSDARNTHSGRLFERGKLSKTFKSFSGSGNNLAGISSASLELTGKRFELLKELAPRTKKIAIPLDPNGVNYKAIVAEVQATAPKFGLGYSEIHVRRVEEMGIVAQSITRKKYDAIYHPPDSLVTEAVEQVVDQAIKEKLPLMTSLLVNVKRGCLATYAADYPALGKQAAALVDKIFKGSKPSELPIELPYKLNLVLNLQTAKAIDLKIAKEILLRADQVFEPELYMLSVAPSATSLKMNGS
jgi:ABC-type uncharacterized transport system substrate-binding protein